MFLNKLCKSKKSGGLCSFALMVCAWIGIQACQESEQKKMPLDEQYMAAEDAGDDLILSHQAEAIQWGDMV